MKPNKTIRFLWKLIGEDEQILSFCEKNTKNYFILSGFLFWFFFLLSIFSFHYVFNGIFQIPILSWPIAIVWSLIVFNIYRLNLSTLSTDKATYSLGYYMSLVIRILFMILIGITLIKPLEVKIFESFLTPGLNKFRTEKIISNQTKIAGYFDKEINAVKEELKNLNLQIQENRITLGRNQILLLENKRDTLIHERETILSETEYSFQTSNFFFNGILIFNKKYPLVWLITVLLLILFLLPLLMKFVIAQNSTYSKQSSQLQRYLILKDYDNFKLKYPQSFKGIPIELIVWEEKYEDPPFNTKRIVIQENFGKEKNFINQIYGV